MKDLLTTIILSIHCIVCYANIIEIKEPAILEVSYEKIMNLDTTSRENRSTREEVMALRIGKTSAMFYPPKRMWYDSLMTANFELSEKLLREANPSGQKFYVPLGGMESEYVFRNVREGQTMVYGRMAGGRAYYLEPTELPEWTVGTETKEILGYDCIKATTSYRGREWTAWFTPEIPISEGPWKLAGLPGLVLEAYDRHSDYRFIATEINTENLQPVGIYVYSSSKPFYYKSRTNVLARLYREYLSGKHTFTLQSAYGKPGLAKGPIRCTYDYLETDYPHEE